ncbi:channel protein, hemolysin III family [Segniliparus rotundus DSM 44985]|uniref:Channel protein, hemolysin III family n=2 Tax=Segniliparus rotundus TaxID=286802 RepID=D6Z902_SEGRD|nr:channel protein, hemolysin III family [Segniliparus rotundus DSM 44985]
MTSAMTESDSRGPAPASVPVKPRMRGWIHVWACAASVVCGIALVGFAATHAGARAGFATALYSLTVCAMFGVSATYHRIHWKTPQSRGLMKRLDHSMIFLFIAGTYTPFCYLLLQPGTYHWILSVVWAGAVAGAVLKVCFPHSTKWLGVVLYLALGWVCVFVTPEILSKGGVVPVALLAVGGVLYSFGAILYATKWPNPWPKTFGHHEFFHAATAIAAICHHIAVWFAVIAII